MMAERLTEIRRDLDSEAYTSYLPKTVRELLDHIAQLEAQRGWAVVVPTKMDDDDWEAIGFQQSTEGQLQRVWDRAVSRIQPIPADRVLGEGMVGVDREAITRLSTAIDDVVITSAHHAIGSIEDKAVSVLCMAFSPIAKALRAQQAKGEVEG